MFESIALKLKNEPIIISYHLCSCQIILMSVNQQMSTEVLAVLPCDTLCVMEIHLHQINWTPPTLMPLLSCKVSFGMTCKRQLISYLTAAEGWVLTVISQMVIRQISCMIQVEWQLYAEVTRPQTFHVSFRKIRKL